MNNTQKIREACIRANPEIVELKFGCEYINIHNSIHSFINKAGTDKHRYVITRSNNGMEGSYGEDLNIFIDVIIGRPIRLEDIVFTLMTVLFDGNQYDAMSRKEIHDLLKLWRFGESFENQPEEVKQFIADLL